MRLGSNRIFVWLEQVSIFRRRVEASGFLLFFFHAKATSFSGRIWLLVGDSHDIRMGEDWFLC